MQIAAADEIAALLANKGNANRVSMLDAAVDQYRDAFTTGATAGVHQDVVVQGVCLDGVRGEQRHRSPQASGVFHHRQKVGVLVAPRIGGAVARVVQALHAGFVAVIDARYAGECHLHEDGEPEACLGKPQALLRHTPGGTLVFWHGVRVGCSAQNRDDARTVMAIKQVEDTGKCLGRIVFRQGCNRFGGIVGGIAGRAGQKVDDQAAERVVHGRVKFVS